MDGWVDHSCMYFTPIRFGILSRTNQIAACIHLIEETLTLKSINHERCDANVYWEIGKN